MGSLNFQKPHRVSPEGLAAKLSTETPGPSYPRKTVHSRKGKALPPGTPEAPRRRPPASRDFSLSSKRNTRVDVAWG